MTKRGTFLVWLYTICLAATPLLAQESAVEQVPLRDYLLGMDCFEKGLYGPARLYLANFIEQSPRPEEPEYRLMVKEAEFTLAKASLRMEDPDAEDQIRQFITRYAPDPKSNQAGMELAGQYYFQDDYRKAIEGYGDLTRKTLSKDDQNELHFNKGYSHFVLRDFDAAASEFAAIIEIKSRYYYPANYYYGMCAFFKQDYEQAIRSFERVTASEYYRPFIPHYICQIYFVRKENDKLIKYAEKTLPTHPENSQEIRHLLGKAYFEKGDYEAALSHLRAHEEAVTKMPAEDFYQLGYTEMKTGHYDRAILHFKQIHAEDTPLGMMANFYLGQCYLETGDKFSARSAFGAASKMEHDTELNAEATYHFGKLSAELQYDYDAIASLESIPLSSPYYTPSQEVMASIFVTTRDFKSSIEKLEAKESLSPALKKAYQEVCLYHGLQLINDGERAEAEKILNKSLVYTPDLSLQAQSIFWLADLEYRKQNYQSSSELYHRYFTVARSLEKLPSGVSNAIANYNQGYNYMKLESYSTAVNFFLEAINGLDNDHSLRTNNYYRQRILPDAIIRAADCQFKRNRYQEALTLYKRASADKLYGFEYALYQEGIILGLQGKQIDKIVVLDELVNKYPQSEFTDEALLQVAVTYLEMNRGEKAIPPLTRLVKEHRNSPLHNTALLRLGLISYNNGDLSAAIEYYNQVLKSNPNQIEIKDALIALEEIYVHDLSEPQPYFALLESLPGYSVSELRKDSISFRSAEIQFEQARYEKAIEGFNAYLNQFPKGSNRIHAFYFRGESYSLLKEYVKALADYNAVVGAGNNVHYLNALEKAALISYNHTREFGQAMAYYNALADAATNEKAVFSANLGALRSAYRMTNYGDVVKLAGQLDASKQMTPELRAETHYYAMKAQMERKEYPEAVMHANKVIESTSNVFAAEARYLIARAYFELGQMDMAGQLCHIANKENASYPYWVAKSLLLLSDVHLQNEDYFNAKAPLDAIIEHFSENAEILHEAKDKLARIEALEAQNTRISKDTSKLLQLDHSKDR